MSAHESFVNLRELDELSDHVTTDPFTLRQLQLDFTMHELHSEYMNVPKETLRSAQTQLFYQTRKVFSDNWDYSQETLDKWEEQLSSLMDFFRKHSFFESRRIQKRVNELRFHLDELKKEIALLNPLGVLAQKHFVKVIYPLNGYGERTLSALDRATRKQTVQKAMELSDKAFFNAEVFPAYVEFAEEVRLSYNLKHEYERYTSYWFSTHRTTGDGLNANERLEVDAELQVAGLAAHLYS